MNETQSDIVIIGAGLTGLTLAYFLKGENYSIQILEASSSIGGRIHTARHENLAPIEMGATWFGNKHTQINKLLAELSIERFEQVLGENAIYEPLSTSPPQLVKLPANPDQASYRIKGGTSTLTEALFQSLENHCQLVLNEKITSLHKHEKHLELTSGTDTYRARYIVSTLPPHLLSTSIKFTPDLPNTVKTVMNSTHTWMGESIKIGLHYPKPFWQASNLSGTIFSNVGPIPEMYEHNDFEGSKYSLKGFLNGIYHTMSKDQRLDMILEQLRKYFGNRVDGYLHYDEKVWPHDPLAYAPYQSDILPHQNNGNPVYQIPLLDDTFLIAGSETASGFPGYMEGAIESAAWVANWLKNQSMYTD